MQSTHSKKKQLLLLCFLDQCEFHNKYKPEKTQVIEHSGTKSFVFPTDIIKPVT